ncbi:hypothetical protein GCM10011384_17690 [Psychrobacillus lasiicapitis]|nr:hypothetical protein GCM10011384_17690 [Psychrobacillus lasiicapitis]
MELQDELYERIVIICSQGDDLVNSFDLENAIQMYLKALFPNLNIIGKQVHGFTQH